VHVVDEPGSKEVADHGGTSAEAYVLAVRSLAGRLERLGRRCVDEVERRAALHLDRRARVMGDDEGRRVERRVGTPPALPLRVLVPSGRAELPSTHDLGADPSSELLRVGVVDAPSAAGLAEHLAAPPVVRPRRTAQSDSRNDGRVKDLHDDRVVTLLRPGLHGILVR
jgi:hypothetical protein